MVLKMRMLPKKFFRKCRFTHAIAGLLLGILLVPLFIAPLRSSAQEPGMEYQVQAVEQEKAVAIGKTGKLELTKVGCTWTEIACGSLWFLNLIADGIIFLVYPLGEGFFLTMVEYNYTAFNTADSPLMLATKTGWDITLGVANIFFVLLLLWIAVATIFDFEPWTARQLLPKLIIAALLINFSLSIGNSIIRLSNGIASIFSIQIEKMGGTGAAIMNIYNPDEILYAMQNQYTSLNKDELTKKLKEWKVKITNSGIPWKNGDYSALDCYNIIQDRTGLVSGSLAGLGDFLINFGTAGNYISTGAHIEAACRKFVSDIEIAKALSALDPTFGKTHILAMSLAAKAFVIPIALFTIFAAGVMLLVRLISLLMLLIFGPLVFLFFAFGPLKSYWTKWWENLFKWSFFMPTFMFLFMMSLIILKGVAPKSADLALVGGKIPNVSELIVYYLIAVGLMIGSLMVGHQMGIAGAGAVTGLGKRMATGTGKWAARRTGRLALRASAPAAQRLESLESDETASRTSRFLARSLNRIPGARRGLQNIANAQKKQVEEYAKAYDDKSSEQIDRLTNMSTANAAMRAAAIKVMMKRRDLDETSNEKIVGAMHYLRDVLGEDIQDLTKAAPHLAGYGLPPEQRQAEMQRLIESIRPLAGTWERMDRRTFEDPMFLELAAHTFGPDHLRTMGAFDQRLRNKFQSALEDNVIDDHGNIVNRIPGLGQRMVYDTASGARMSDGMLDYLYASPGRGLGYRPPPSTATLPPGYTYNANRGEGGGGGGGGQPRAGETVSPRGIIIPPGAGFERNQ